MQLHRDYQKDIKFLKTFYRPDTLSSLDIIVYFPLSEDDKNKFKTEETRIFNLMIQQSQKGTHPSIMMDSDFKENHKISKMTFKPFLKIISADFFTLPNIKFIFREKLEKFFKLLKSWTKSDYFNLDFEYLKEALEGTDKLTEITASLNASFKLVKSLETVNNIVAENLFMNLEVFYNNFRDKAKSKLLFLNRDQSISERGVLLVVLAEFLLKKSIGSRSLKEEREVFGKFVNKSLIKHIVNRFVKTSKTINDFFEGVKKKSFKLFDNTFMNEQEFHAIVDLQKTIYGPIDFNHKYFSKSKLFEFFRL